MQFTDLRAALYLVFAILICWRVSVGVPEGYWPYTAGFAVLVGLTRVIERQMESRRLRRDVAYLASLDPVTAQQRIGHFWSAYARRTYEQLLREEGSVEAAEGVEQFPYAKGERRACSRRFWCACSGAAIAFALLFTIARHAAWTPWILWSAGALCIVAAVRARSRDSELASTLEVSRFGLTRVAEDGSRQSVRWNRPLLLQNQPRRRRVLLATHDGAVVVPLGYRRVGFECLLRLTIEHGGFSVGGAG